MKPDKNVYHQDYFHKLKDDLLMRTENVDNNTLIAQAMLNKDFPKVVQLTTPDQLALCDPNEFVSDEGDTLLYIAAYMGELRVLEHLIQAGCELNTFIFPHDSELFGAVRGNHLDCTQLLIDRGSLVDPKHEDWTPMHVACFNKSESMIRLLCKYTVDINCIGVWTYTPLNMLFVEYAKREKFQSWFTDENCILRCLEALCESKAHLDVNYSSICAIGNPPSLQRALVLVSPKLCRFLLNCGASTDCLLREELRVVHDELVMFTIHSSKIGSSREERAERYWQCLHMLLLTGCDEITVKLPTLGRVLLRQLHNVNLVRYPEMEPVFRNILRFILEPRPLSTLCIHQIRKSLQQPIYQSVKELNCAPSAAKCILLERTA